MQDGFGVEGLKQHAISEIATPCPFCSNRRGLIVAEFGFYEDDNGEEKGVWSVMCPCGAHGPDGMSAEDALIAWMQRGMQ